METINEKIRNQLTPMVNMVTLIKQIKNSKSESERTKYLSMLYSLTDAAEVSIEKMCKLGYNKYEEVRADVGEFSCQTVLL